MPSFFTFKTKIKIGLFFSVLLVGFLISSGEAKAAVPFGHVDEVTSNGYVRGWAIDPDANGWHLEIHAYFDGPAGQSQAVAGSSTNLPRCDVKYNLSINECGFGRGFEIAIPAHLKDGKTHTVYVYALNVRFDDYQGFVPDQPAGLLIGSPKSFKLGSSDTRHDTGTWVSHNGTVYLIGTEKRFPFPSAEVFFSWGGDFAKVVPASAGDLTLPIGPLMQVGNRKPIGHVDLFNSTSGTIEGWALDPDRQLQSVDIHVYFDAPAALGRTAYLGLASNYRPDVNSATGYSGDHGFQFFVPPAYRDGLSHKAYVYAIDRNDTSGTANVLLPGSPVTFSTTQVEKPVINYFFATPYNAESGQAVTLTWSTKNAAYVTLAPGVHLNLSTTGSVTVYPTAKTTFTLTAYNSRGEVAVETEQVLVMTEAYKRDLQRTDDLFSIILGLSEYYEAKQFLPNSLAEMVPAYLTSIPTPPTASQNCTADQNKYGYEKLSQTKFAVTFCFEEEYSEEFKAGPNRFEYDFQEAVTTSRDAQRLASVRQIMTGLELYYNDFGNYPTSLSLLTPTYLYTVPSAPTPADGSCTATNNQFAYQQLSGGQNYSLSFCLGTSTGGFTSGVHLSGPSGIQ
jgi:hypothetical protein